MFKFYKYQSSLFKYYFMYSFLLILALIIKVDLLFIIINILFIVSEVIRISILRKHKKEKEILQNKKIRELKQKYIEQIDYLESLLCQIDYLTDEDINFILSSFLRELNYNNSEVDYLHLLSSINGYIEYFEARYKEFECKKSSEKCLDDNEISKYLQILDLPSDTRDFHAIKKQYHLMMKKFHPDVNKSSEAVKKSQSINLAYEELYRAIGKKS